MKVFELQPTDAHKSFYRKAHCIEDNGIYYLKSYETIVASIDSDGTFHRYWDGYSATTMRHIVAFLNCFGERGITKGDWESLEVEQ